MRHVSALAKTVISLSLLAGMAARVPAQILTPRDWLLHRGSNSRVGSNSDPGVQNRRPNPTVSTWNQVAPAWVYPASRDMPAEMVVDNTTLPAPIFPTAGGAPSRWDNRDFPARITDPQDPNTPPRDVVNQQFGVSGTWFYPTTAERGPAAWPLSDAVADKVGDYVYTPAVKSDLLANIGLDTLQRLPNLGTDLVSATTYSQIDQELRSATTYARWTFGTNYPTGSQQGTVDVTGKRLVPNQRYAIYIRFPSSPTLDAAGVAHPNTDHVLVRVSWGADINDPKTSRIFLMSFGDTGGYWKRVRSGPGDDRYFPYQGLLNPALPPDPITNPSIPITVTLYNLTPDDQPNSAGVTTYVTADAVRLVPEALRGDIHAPAASFVMPPGAATDPLATTYSQLTVFGRDETTGPAILFPTAANYSPPVGFTGALLDPTLPPHPVTNPAIFDPTQSIRSAVFYCLRDDIDKNDSSRNRYARLQWRYPARVLPVIETTVDDGAAGYTNTAGFAQVVAPKSVTDQAFGPTYALAPAVLELGAGGAGPTENAVWTAPVYGSGTFSVLVWIPGGDTNEPNKFAHRARYRITTDQGDQDYYLDQRNTDDSAIGLPRTGTWRLLATGIRFPGNVATVTLYNDTPQDDVTNARFVVADAVKFVPESATSNSVVAAPLVARVRWPSGRVRTVVYFGTTDGRLWALDAVGVDQDALGNPIAAQTSTQTHAYWVYPSIANPELANPADPPATRLASAVLTSQRNDPNWRPDPFNALPSQGIDGDLTKNDAIDPNGDPDLRTAAPTLGPFVSSPAYVEVGKDDGMGNITYTPFIIVGNSNGRVYGFDPVGRTSGGEPYAVTFAAGDAPGVPGTTRRTLTWPTIPRDKWLRKGGAGQPGGLLSINKYTDDGFGPQAQVVASVAANRSGIAANPVNGVEPSNTLIAPFANYAGQGYGHVYAVDLTSVDVRVRISNENNDGKALWQFPESTTTTVPPITHAGALTTNQKYIFSAGGRVYCIRTPPTTTGGHLTPEWTYPYAAAPADPVKTNDVDADENLFTAPAWRTGVAGINGGNEVVYVANRDGTVRAIDSTVTGNPIAGPPILFRTATRGTTRASVVFLNSLPPQAPFIEPPGPNKVQVPPIAGPAVDKPALLLPNDAGGIIGTSVEDDGKLMWLAFDAGVGRIPITQLDSNDNPITVTVSASSAYRGADVTTANSWLFQGDEGNQDTGEINGQMRSYANVQITGGMVTPGEPEFRPEDAVGLVDIRLLELWDTTRDNPQSGFDAFGETNLAVAKSPYDEWAANREKANTLVPQRFLVYEWGDEIAVVAWGTYTGNIPPTVTFRLQGGNQNRPPVTVGAVRDRVWEQPPKAGTLDPPGGPGTVPPGTDVYAWVAKTRFPIGRGSDADSQTPGRKYTVSATAQIQTPGGAIVPTSQLNAGQAYVTKSNPNPAPGQDENQPAVAEARKMALAHPIAITTRGITGVAVGSPNNIGWTTTADAASVPELLANGNRLSTVTGSDVVPAAQRKGIIAPIGMVPHGATLGYSIFDPNQNRPVQGLYIADRSNLWKLNQPLNNVRVERRDLEWGWNPNNTSYSSLAKATGNVMNPLPWERFPSTYPNLSSDYPNINRTRSVVRLGGNDLARRSVTIDLPAVDPNTRAKTLRPVPLDLAVDVPRFQPANVNHEYTDINNQARTDMIAPILSTTGVPATSGRISPSGGYYGSIAIFIDSNNSGRYEGAQLRAQAQQAGTQAREEVYREFLTGVAVSPDLSLRVEEQTIDLGDVPHGLGYAPNIPFAPTGIGPYRTVSSPYESFFAPFTVKNTGNVNLVNLRVAKVVGNNAVAGNPSFWLNLSSDQVDPFPMPLGGGLLWMRPFNPLGGAAAGNRGLVTSLDHGRGAGNSTYDLETDYSGFPAPFGQNFWPHAAGNPYVVAGNALGWPDGVNPYPTLGKARPGDTAPTVMGIPDVAYGDPLSARPSGVDLRPRIGIAVPVGTPVGTYSARIHVYEDAYPEQWRRWQSVYSQITGSPNPLLAAEDNDGILNRQYDPNTNLPVGPPAEATVQSPFTLKLTVREARMTNGVTAGSWPVVDVRAANAPPLGGNVTPGALRDPVTGDLLLAWASDRRFSGGQWLMPARPDSPWSLFVTQLNAVTGGGVFDWRFETGLTRWWEPIPDNTYYPDPTTATSLFPAQPSETQDPRQPTVPGVIMTDAAGNPMIRAAAPHLVQQEGANPATWLFWQGMAFKNTGSGAQSFTTDLRTFYAPLTKTGGRWQPGSAPLSLFNDPAIPKFRPRPLLLTDGNGNSRAYLFWYGGGQGRGRLYYNLHTGNLNNPAGWSTDRVLPTPGNLQSLADPYPVRRRIAYSATVTPSFDMGTRRFTSGYESAAAVNLDAIDLLYTGVMPGRKTPETFLTRYLVAGNGNLATVILPPVENEVLARDGTSLTWTARNIAWLYRSGSRYVDANGNPFFIIYVNGQQVNVVNAGNPVTFDDATGKLYFNVAPVPTRRGVNLGGRMVVDPQLGTVTFLDVAPGPTDTVSASYIPQTMRVNVTRAEPGNITVPAGWSGDAGFAARPHVALPGANTEPVGIFDGYVNPKFAAEPWVFLQGSVGNATPTTSRLWALYRKSGSAANTTAALYYKAMRLMVRLPRGVLRNLDGTINNGQAQNIVVTGNRGPVEVDWIRGRLYFTELDEGNLVTVAFNYARQTDASGNVTVLSVPATVYRVQWGDESSAAAQPADQTTGETVVPMDAAVNEGQLTAFRDPLQARLWLFWSSTRAGTADLYYMTLSPRFDPQPGPQAQ